MKNNKLHLLWLFFITVIFVFSFSAFAVVELEKSIPDKNVSVFARTISETEQELKEPDLTDNELKFFRNKLLKIMESLISVEKECTKEIATQNELIENYSLSLLRKDKEKSTSSEEYPIEKFKKLREEIGLYKNYLNSIQESKEKANLLLDDIEYKGIRNRTRELFLLGAPFYEKSVWTDGYKDFVQLSIDGKEKLRKISDALNGKTIAKLLFLLGIAIVIIYVYVKTCIKLFKFLLSKLDYNNKQEITSYKGLLSEKSFFIFSRFLICFLIPSTIIKIAMDYYCEKHFLSVVNTTEGLFIIIVINTFTIIWLLQTIVSTYFIKNLNFLYPLFTESKAFKRRVYGIIYLIAGLCFINYVDLVNVAIKFNPMVYPDCAAILNLLIITLLSISLFRVIPYLSLYIKAANKRASFITQIINGFLALWAILAPIMVFFGLSSLTIDIALKIAQTGALLFLYYYAYYFIKEVVPLLIGSAMSFFNKITFTEEEKYPDNEHDLHKKHPHSKYLLKYWFNILISTGIIIFITLKLLVIWGFPQNTLSYLLNTIFFEQIHIAGKPTFSISLLFTSLISGLVVFYIFKIIQHIFEIKVFPYTRLDEGTRHAFKTTIGYIGLMFAVIIFVYVLGINMTALTFIISGLSIGIGFSLQELFKNFFSGFVLLIERPIKIGDILNINGRPAKVKKIRIRCTVLESSEKDTIIIPNSELVNSKVVNETTFPLSCVDIEISVAYSENPIRVAELLKTVADSYEKISKTFKSTVEFVKFNNNSITLILKVVVKRIEKDEATSTLKFMLFNAMKDNKIAMPETPLFYIKEVD